MRTFGIAARVAILSIALWASPPLQARNSFAGNPYSPTRDHPYRHGVVPTTSTWKKMRAWASANPEASQNTGTDILPYGGGMGGNGVVSGKPVVYLVIYGSQWGTAGTDANGNTTFTGDPSGEVPRLEQLFKGLGTAGELWSGVMTQYCDGFLVAAGATSCPSVAPHVIYPNGGGVLAGVWYDNSGPSPSEASGTQLAEEAVNAAAHFGNTTPGSNRYVQYMILSPTGTHPDGYNPSSWCAWHDYSDDPTLSTGGPAPSPYGHIAFTNLPYITDMGPNCGENWVNPPSTLYGQTVYGGAGLLDGVTMVSGHEYAETLTDEYPPAGWANVYQVNGQTQDSEDGDECAWIQPGQPGGAGTVNMGDGSFPMQATWSNDTDNCALSHPIVVRNMGFLTPVLGLLLQ